MQLMSVPARVLVVDDDPATREAVEPHLTHRGYEVVTAGNGEEMLGILTRQKISCMLADARLFGSRTASSSPARLRGIPAWPFSSPVPTAI